MNRAQQRRAVRRMRDELDLLDQADDDLDELDALVTAARTRARAQRCRAVVHWGAGVWAAIMFATILLGATPNVAELWTWIGSAALVGWALWWIRGGAMWWYRRRHGSR